MKVQKYLAVAIALMVLAPIAQAEWNFTWYVNDTGGSPSFVFDSTGATWLPEGNIVYLVSTGPNGTPDGLNLDGTFVDPLEYVVVLWGGGDTTATIGDVDVLPPPFDVHAGEFELTSTIDETQLFDPIVYAISFDVPVSYLGAGVGFQVGTPGYFGVSGTTYNITGPNLSWDAQGWSTNQPIVPEPTTIALMIAGLGGVVAYRKKRQAA
jgi:hypothetical protein